MKDPILCKDCIWFSPGLNRRIIKNQYGEWEKQEVWDACTLKYNGGDLVYGNIIELFREAKEVRQGKDPFPMREGVCGPDAKYFEKDPSPKSKKELTPFELFDLEYRYRKTFKD